MVDVGTTSALLALPCSLEEAGVTGRLLTTVLAFRRWQRDAFPRVPSDGK